jgi:hypothetical protein
MKWIRIYFIFVSKSAISQTQNQKSEEGINHVIKLRFYVKPRPEPGMVALGL